MISKQFSVQVIYLLKSVKPSVWVSFLLQSCRYLSPSQFAPVSSLHQGNYVSSSSSLSCRGRPRWPVSSLPPQSSAARQTCSPNSSDVGPVGRQHKNTQASFQWQCFEQEKTTTITKKQTFNIHKDTTWIYGALVSVTCSIT